MRLAAIDIGSNSTRLLIVEQKKGRLQELLREKITTRPGADIEQGILSREAIFRIVKALQKFKTKINEYKVDRSAVVGTSALREVKNREEIKKIIKGETGFNLEIISGFQEAQLVYRGVFSSIDEKDFLIIDIGGGSTEFVWKNKQDKKKINLKSVNMGAVRFKEKFILDSKNPISPKEEKKIKDSAGKLIKKQLPGDQKFKKAVGVGGTITTLGAIKQKLTDYDPQKIHLFSIEKTSVRKIYKKICSLNLNERKEIKGLEPARADIICVGILILLAVMDFLEIGELIISEHDLLYGLINRLHADNF